MTNLAHIRLAALAVVTLAGAFHLRTAEAQPVLFATCEENAIAYGTGYCDGATGGNWTSGEITYTCGANGTISNAKVTCQ